MFLTEVRVASFQEDVSGQGPTGVTLEDPRSHKKYVKITTKIRKVRMNNIFLTSITFKEFFPLKQKTDRSVKYYDTDLIS